MAYFPSISATILYTVKTIDYQHSEIHSGRAYSLSDSLVLGAAVKKEFLFYTGDVYPHLTFDIGSTSGETSLRFFEAPSVVGGSISGAAASASITAGSTCSTWIFNRNRATPRAMKMGVSGILAAFAGVAGSGMQIYYSEIGSVGTGIGGSSTKISGNALNRPEWILNANTFYWLQIASKTAGNRISYALDWYEEDE